MTALVIIVLGLSVANLVFTALSVWHIINDIVSLEIRYIDLKNRSDAKIRKRFFEEAENEQT